MDFTNWDRTLTAQKGWVILNDKIVFLGSNIKNTNGIGNVSTTIDQRKDDSKTPYTTYVNGKTVDLKQASSQQFTDTKSVFLESKNLVAILVISSLKIALLILNAKSKQVLGTALIVLLKIPQSLAILLSL